MPLLRAGVDCSQGGGRNKNTGLPRGGVYPPRSTAVFLGGGSVYPPRSTAAFLGRGEEPAHPPPGSQIPQKSNKRHTKKSCGGYSSHQWHLGSFLGVESSPAPNSIKTRRPKCNLRKAGWALGLCVNPVYLVLPFVF